MGCPRRFPLQGADTKNPEKHFPGIFGQTLALGGALRSDGVGRPLKPPEVPFHSLPKNVILTNP